MSAKSLVRLFAFAQKNKNKMTFREFTPNRGQITNCNNKSIISLRDLRCRLEILRICERVRNTVPAVGGVESLMYIAAHDDRCADAG